MYVCVACLPAKLLQLCLTVYNPIDCSHQAPLSIGFSRQEYWSGLSFSSPGALPDPGIKARSPVLQADSLPTEISERWSIWKPQIIFSEIAT